MGAPWVNPRSDPNILMNGMADEQATFSTFLASLPNGAVVGFDDRANLRANSQILISGKRVDMEGRGPAKISTTSILTVPLVRYLNAPDSRFTGLAIEGVETTFRDANPLNVFALEAKTSDRISVQGVRVSGFSQGINLDECHHARVDDYQFLGLLAGFVTWAQNHQALRTVRGHDNHLTRIAARSTGSAILAGGPADGLRIWGVDAIDCWDNAVYLSQANDAEVSGVVARMIAALGGTTNTGVKARGNRNNVHDCLVAGFGTGYALTGYGSGAPYLDADGYNGIASRVTDSFAYNCPFTGILIGLYLGRASRDFEVVKNHLEACGDAASSATNSILVEGSASYSPRSVKLDQNTIVGHIGSGPAIRFISATVAAPFITPEVTRNHLRGFASAIGVRANFAIEGVFEQNHFEAIAAAYALMLENGTDNLVTGNRKRGTAGTSATLRMEATCTGTRRYLNHNCTVTDLGSGSITTP
jgi:hypothetical protein